MHMVAAMLVCETVMVGTGWVTSCPDCMETVMVGTGWVTSCPDCMDKLTKHYSHLVGCWFLARMAAWALSGCMTTESVDYCMLIMGMINVMSLLINA